MAAKRVYNVFIEYVKPSYDKTAWGAASYLNGWRHARLVVTDQPLTTITDKGTGTVYDAYKGEDKTLEGGPGEAFKPTEFNRYLPIGHTALNSKDILAKRDKCIADSVKYDLLNNNCENFARSLATAIVDGGKLPVVTKKLGTTHAEMIHYIDTLETSGFDQGFVYDPHGHLDASKIGAGGPVSLAKVLEK